jgi:hypothetical protein
MNKNFFDFVEKKDYKFNELPLGAQKGIAGRWFIEGGCFLGGDVLSDEILKFLPESANESNYAQELSESQWSEILKLIINYYSDKDNNFTYFEAPTECVKDVLLKNVDSFEDYENWEEYSDDYGKVHLHSKIDRFPCFYCLGYEEIFEDGWHRLHSYINQGHLTIPIIEY